MRARGDSVMLIASTKPLSASALAKNSDRSMPLGGVSSVVTTKRADRVFSSKCLMCLHLVEIPIPKFGLARTHLSSSIFGADPCAVGEL
jgi:hypothetical protein